MLLSRGATRLLTLIKKFLDRYGPNGCRFGQEWLAREFGKTSRTIRNWCNELRQAGIITTRRRSQDTMVYRLVNAEISGQVSGRISGQVSGRYIGVPSITITPSHQRAKTARVRRKPPQKECALDRMLRREGLL